MVWSAEKVARERETAEAESRAPTVTLCDSHEELRKLCAETLGRCDRSDRDLAEAVALRAEMTLEIERLRGQLDAQILRVDGLGKCTRNDLDAERLLLKQRCRRLRTALFLIGHGQLIGEPFDVAREALTLESVFAVVCPKHGEVPISDGYANNGHIRFADSDDEHWRCPHDGEPAEFSRSVRRG